jgi:dipeptidyl aminopeptidase/acylaminoacyl peptidase
MKNTILTLFVLIFSAVAALAQPNSQSSTEKRPMSFLDMRELKRAGSYNVSTDGKWLLFTVSTPNWETAKNQTDIHLVSVTEGLPSSRQMTFTEEKSENSPKWSKDGQYFVFSSDRDGKENQLYMMRPDGGEARKITEAKEGVSSFEFSPDGKWLVYKSGKPGNEQLHALPADNLHGAEPETITKQEAGVNNWEWSPDSKRIYFISPNEADKDNLERKEKGFTVDVKNYETPLRSLWFLDVASKEAKRLTEDDSYTVSSFEISDDGKWVGYTGTSAERYERNITEQRINADLFLLNTSSGAIERLTDNEGVAESGPYFSPDGNMMAFVASSDMSGYNMRSRKVYVRQTNDKGGSFKMLGGKYNDHIGFSFWSEDGNTIYFNTGVRATRQLLALDVKKDKVQQITDEKASLLVSQDEDSGAIMVNYSDPKTPSTLFSVPSLDKVTDRSAWVQLTDVNPQVRSFALGEQKEITYKSTDGKEASGVLILPVDYQEGQRYPLVVSIHGGPASATLLSFNPGYGGQVYAGAGYVLFSPNYRGSTNYGEQFRIDIVGNYFPQAFDDIMAGVDHLIDEGIVDEDQMGVFGWSAGGHWSNWILTHTDRFKAISSGAGTMNWISMYAQSDVQRNRQFYLGDDLPYDNFDAYWEQSPLKYIKNAKTPTMIHVVAGDPRVPSPQSVELHMALKKLGVDTELFMYPGRSHGIPDTRNRLVKSVSEMAWMDYYVRGIGEKFSWNQVLKTLETKKEKKEEPTNE